MDVTNYFYTVIIEYLLPVLATNIIVDYSSVFVSETKRKKVLPVICMVVSIIIGALYALIYYTDTKSFILQIFYTFTFANLVYSLGIFSYFKTIILDKSKFLIDKITKTTTINKKEGE